MLDVWFRLRGSDDKPCNQNFGVVFIPVNRYIMSMMHSGKTLVCIMGVWALCLAANGATSESATSPYQGIVERNVFGLKPPPPPPGPEDNKPPAPKIFLTGITTILGTKVALMKLTPPPAKPGEPAKEESFTLKVGQRQ